jgi:hypothetical protein
VTAPKLFALATLVDSGDRFVTVDAGHAGHFDLHFNNLVPAEIAALNGKHRALRVTIEPASPAPSPPRSAEEIAREMVQPMTREDRVDGEFRMLVRAGGWQTEVSTRAPDTLVCVVARAIEQANVDGAAAERAAQNERLTAQIRDDWKIPAVDHYREGLHRIWRGEPNPQAIACSYLGEDDPSQPRDLAGRIRALVMEYAGRWCDAVGDADVGVENALAALRFALAAHNRGGDVQNHILWMKQRTCQYTRRAADELEAIVRECGEEKRS